MALVLFLNGRGGGLQLEEVERGEDGRVTRAWVVNGNWVLRIVGAEAQAKRGQQIVTRWLIKTYEEVTVKGYGGYDEVIERARKKGTGCSIST